MRGEAEWDELWSQQEVADRLRVHVRTFRRWCADGHGPTVTMLGALPRYAESDVKRWIATRKTQVEVA